TSPRSRGESWAASLDRFVEWERAARPEIRMVLGAGIDEKTIEAYCKGSSIRAFHLGRTVRERKRIDGAVLVERVREVEELVRRQAP
ncbi:MAG: hypothetical protein J2P52_14015, partial [Blastocatellia bacterium]|nr:hypothetical protein [Blastocatellia bacterium]